MKIQIIILCVLSAVLIGCNEKKETQTDTNLAKQDYTAEKNSVEIYVLKLMTFNKQLISNGRFEARRKSDIGFKSTGEITAINVYEGSKINAGSTIAMIDASEYEIALQRAELAFRKAEIDLIDKLAGYDYINADTSKIPREVMEIAYIRSGYLDAKNSLASAKMNLNNCRLTAPFSGKIADIKSKLNERSQSTFCTIIDDAILNVKFTILETELNFVRTGQKVQVSTFTNPDVIIKGHITEITPSVNEKGQISIIAQIQNNGELIDGMNVKIIIENSIANQMVVPKSAVVIRDNMEVLFRYSNGKSVWTYVNIQMTNSKEYVVSPNTSRGAELNVGDTVIVKGNLNLGGDVDVEIENKK
ncbi:MAG: efflux RND transporter periplasmic adaptor subunit [Prevotellaceae bacterium]|jgi:RND family efflux transporter MFP subunit|nr:efflux RND transporter periplasmic adaptor subunit [Prevotellaceae bacterium]